MEDDRQILIVTIAQRVNWVVERLCALLMGVMVVVIWFGVIERYFLHLGHTWTEELSRYVMIWAALLAVSCGAYYREHIGLNMVQRFLPPNGAKILSKILDIVSFSFFIFLTWYGFGMARDGLGQYATIFGITMVVPFAAVPVSSALCAFQVLVSMFRKSEPVGASMVQTQ
ncbi:TRAP transporter small permease [Desulforhopalus sp. IMCC35007]|uniref:TRAP transporter small permease n=1 Tax=Desulforhopalus sp. IMCC35007 TaxID=2569543 RepID=UPI0010ADF58E|nr:TRAP transporter small permease [Desulforhopalus sp. IMCC35007]TKB06768.1 TRAP transporter small permease [Desulforhopalus sp. IMCC35007]